MEECFGNKYSHKYSGSVIYNQLCCCTVHIYTSRGIVCDSLLFCCNCHNMSVNKIPFASMDPDSPPNKITAKQNRAKARSLPSTCSCELCSSGIDCKCQRFVYQAESVFVVIIALASATGAATTVGGRAAAPQGAEGPLRWPDTK